MGAFLERIEDFLEVGETDPPRQTRVADDVGETHCDVGLITVLVAGVAFEGQCEMPTPDVVLDLSEGMRHLIHRPRQVGIGLELTQLVGLPVGQPGHRLSDGAGGGDLNRLGHRVLAVHQKSQRRNLVGVEGFVDAAAVRQAERIPDLLRVRV